MQPLVVDLERAGAVLFVRSLAHLPNAINTVNQLLSMRRTIDAPGEEVLGIVVHEQLADTLPAPTFGGGAKPAAVSVRETAGICGIWSLCWFDFMAPEGRVDAERRRSLLLDFLLFGGAADLEAPEGSRLLLPVFTSSEASQSDVGLVEKLSARYPMLAIGPRCYLHDGSRKSLVPRA